MIRFLISDVCIEEPFSTSDHCAVSFCLLVEALVVPPVSNEVRQFRNADYEGISNFLQTLNWNLCFDNCVTVEDYAETFYAVMRGAVETYVPVRKCNRRGRKFSLPKQLRVLRAQKKVLWRNRKSENGRILYKQACEEFKTKVESFVLKKEKKCISSANVSDFYKFVNSKN